MQVPQGIGERLATAANAENFAIIIGGTAQLVALTFTKSTRQQLEGGNHMRRMLAILIILTIIVWTAFWMAYAWFPSVKASANDFAMKTLGPTVYTTLRSGYRGIVSVVGIPGFAGIMVLGGVIVGVFVQKLWTRADWRLRRWGANRTRKDLGVSDVRDIGAATPATASTRPPAPKPQAPPPEPAPAPEPAPPPKKKTPPKEEAQA